jgi:hypothetical protein
MVDRDLERLHRLEGFSQRAFGRADSRGKEVCVFEEGRPPGHESRGQVHATLRDHASSWKEAGAGPFIMGVVGDGLKLRLYGEPEDYHEPNNQSFVKEKVFGVAAVREMARKKVLRKVGRSEVKCINPLTVATNSKGKRRLCIDLSRHVNFFTATNKFRVESTNEFRQTVEQGDFMASFDLESAFHQVRVNELYQKYFGLGVTVGGVDEFFVFESMPFGFNDACRVLTKLLRLPLHRWRCWGAKAFIHVDDGIVAAAGRAEAQKLARAVQADLRHFGLLTSEAKCNWTVSQELEWTGFKFDTARFMVFIPDWKVRSILSKLKCLLAKAKGGRPVSMKELSSAISSVGACGIALGRVARFRTRFSMMQVARVTQDKGWSESRAREAIEAPALEEIEFWRDNLERLNGAPIRNRPGIQVVRFGMKPQNFYSDAGEWMAGGGRIEGGRIHGNSIFKITLTEEESASSSTRRELLGIEAGLRALGPGMQERSIRWHCDNWMACKIIELGSMKPDLMVVALRIDDLIKRFRLQFEIVWQRRETEEIRFADRISKDFDFGDYRISMQDFHQLEERFGGFSADYFASDYSFRMQPFFSRYLSDRSEGSDALSRDWSAGFGYFHPPVGLVAAVLHKAEHEEARGLLLVPDWPGSWAGALLDSARRRGKLRLRGRFRPTFECPAWFENQTFKGVPDFDMLMLEMV